MIPGQLGASVGGMPTGFRVSWDQIVPGIGVYDAGGGADITTATTLGPEHNQALVDASGGAVTITLPTLSEAYQEVVVSKRDSSGNAVTVDASGSETINGALTVTITGQYDTIRVRPGNTEWILA